MITSKIFLIQSLFICPLNRAHEDWLYISNQQGLYQGIIFGLENRELQMCLFLSMLVFTCLLSKLVPGLNSTSLFNALTLVFLQADSRSLWKQLKIYFSGAINMKKNSFTRLAFEFGNRWLWLRKQPWLAMSWFIYIELKYPVVL